MTKLSTRQTNHSRLVVMDNIGFNSLVSECHWNKDIFGEGLTQGSATHPTNQLHGISLLLLTKAS